jgi:hypothetical protein
MKPILNLGIPLTLAFLLFAAPSLYAKDSVWSKEAQILPALKLYAEAAPYIAALTYYMHDQTPPEEENGLLGSVLYEAAAVKATIDIYRLADKVMDVLSNHLKENHIF